ncbi:ubinuclein-2-like isoform X2 [Lineus longissimus]|uniref:ubinuclein-2-like isoform X2 n=1 Tax=Lineus longissimus TaxID=88925 RepID=UPI00315C7620
MLGETSCGPLCQHPACWASINQQLKGVRQRQVELKDNLTDSSDDEDELPTQKVYNMLDDYGSDKRDRYPSKHQGRPKEKQKSAEPMPFGMSLRTGTTAPFTTPATMSGGPRKFVTPQITSKTIKTIPQFNKVEVQELFDLDDLQKDWHETFYASKCLVWVPGKKKTPRPPETERMTISKLSQGPVPLPTKDMTESMVPVELERQRESEQSRRHHRRSMSPRRPRSMQTRFINLLDLPRDILRAVLDNLEQSDDLTRDEIQNALLQVVPEFSRHETALTLTSSSILQQQKVKLVESRNRNVRQPELHQTKPAFQLDEPPPPLPNDYYDAESVISSNREIRSLSDYPPGHGKKKPLPSLRAPSPKSKNKMTSISLGLPEIPTGYKFTKPFTYYKGSELDFSLAPVTSVAPSERESITRESDVDSTLHVTIPTVASERDELEYTYQRGTAGEVLHHVSPADSTNVPKTPAATPVSRSKASGGQGLGSQSSRGVVQLPVHAPPASPVSMDTTNLGPVREISFDVLPETEKARQIAELQNSHNQLKSRGGRSVHFAPGIASPSSVPTGANSQSNTPITNHAASQTPVTPTGTSATSMAVTGAQISRTIDPSPGTRGPVLVIRDKDSSITSSPELWPVVNEDDYMLSPEPIPRAADSEKSILNETPDSRIANLDERSVKALTTPAARSEGSAGMRPDMLKLLPDSDFSPAPPPPSPEMRQSALAESEELESPDKLERRSAKELSMLPVLEEEHTDGSNTDRTDVTAGQPETVELAGFKMIAPVLEEATEYENMANNAISSLMIKLGDNFPTSEQMMADMMRRNSEALVANVLEEENQEMTEDGGDHNGFKKDLQEELGNIDERLEDLNGKDDDGEGSQGKGSEGSQGKRSGFGQWNWVQ